MGGVTDLTVCLTNKVERENTRKYMKEKGGKTQGTGKVKESSADARNVQKEALKNGIEDRNGDKEDLNRRSYLVKPSILARF